MQGSLFVSLEMSCTDPVRCMFCECGLLDLKHLLDLTNLECSHPSFFRRQRIEVLLFGTETSVL